MAIKIMRNGNQITAKGWPAGSIAGTIFGAILLIFGALAIFANPIVAFVILLVANLILYASRRHGNTVRKKRLAEEMMR